MSAWINSMYTVKSYTVMEPIIDTVPVTDMAQLILNKIE